MFRDSVSESSGESGLAEEDVGVSLNPKNVTWWRNHVGTEPLCPRGQYHSHGILAASRTVLENAACAAALLNEGAVVVDVGGCPRRTYPLLQERGWFMVPDLHHGDNTRARECPVEARPHMCRHLLEECSCVSSKRVLLFTHSAYYFSHLDLWQRLRDPNVVDVYVIGHVFNDAYGGFMGDECTWEHNGAVVKMAVKGNAHVYEHMPLPWAVGWRGPSGESFHAETMRGVGDFTYLWRVRAVYDHSKTEMTWQAVETKQMFVGPLQFSSSSRGVVADNARIRNVEIDVDRVFRIGPVLYTDSVLFGTVARVTIPINLVSVGANHCVGRARDPNLFNEVTYILKSRANGMRVPPALQPQVVAVAAVLSLVVNLEVETDLLNTVHGRFKWAYDVHAALVAFRRPSLWSCGWLVCCVFALVVPLVPLLILDRDPAVQIAAPLSVAVAIMWLFACVCGCHRVAQSYHDSSVKRWKVGLRSNPPVGGELVGGSSIEASERGLTGTRYIRDPLREGLLGDYYLLPNVDTGKEVTRSHLAGIVVPTATVNVLEPTQEAELSAVTHRILAPKLNPTEDDLKDYNRTIRSSATFRALAGTVHLDFHHFKLWVDGLKQYPVAYREKLIESWKRIQGTRPSKEKTKPFLKLEKGSSTVQVDGQKATKPRLIQPPMDDAKAALGYVVDQMYHFALRAWDGIKTKVVYASGRSTDYIGGIVDTYLARHSADGVEAYIVDMSCYDSTLGIQLQDGIFEGVYKEVFGVPPWLLEWFTQTRTAGKTPHGVSYEACRRWTGVGIVERDNLIAIAKKYGLKCSVAGPDEGPFVVEMEDFQMTSGRPDTNLMDTLVNAASFVGILDDSGIDYLLLICGDDGFLLTPKTHVGIIKFITEHQIGLGLKPEGFLAEGRHQWEFCSKLFWYGKDPVTGKVQTVLAPKPGRGIARMGSVITVPRAANISQAALSMRIDAGHVPFLRLVADRTFELCRDKKIRPHGRDFEYMRASRRFDVADENYVLVADRYKLGRENEVALADALSRVNELPVIVNVPFIAGMARVDEE